MRAPASSRSLVAVLLGLSLAIFLGDVAAAQEDGAGVQGTLTYEAEDEAAEEKLPAEGVTLVIYEAELSPDGRQVVAAGRTGRRSGHRRRGRVLLRPAGRRRLRHRAAGRHAARGCRPGQRGPRAPWPCGSVDNQRRNVLFNLAEGDAGGGRAAASEYVRPRRPPVRRGHQVRPDHRHVRRRAVADLRHDRPRQLRPLRDDHAGGGVRLLLQRHARHPADPGRDPGDDRSAGSSARVSTW